MKASKIAYQRNREEKPRYGSQAPPCAAKQPQQPLRLSPPASGSTHAWSPPLFALVVRESVGSAYSARFLARSAAEA